MKLASLIAGCLAMLFVVTMAVRAQRVETELVPPAPIRFTNVDLVVDPHGNPLAAYQLEFTADPSRVTLVGIEGGQHAAFNQPPYYDPKALSGSRVILAALNTGTDLPKDKTRVARLHLRVTGAGQPVFSAKMIVAASSNDKTIPADVSVTEGALQ